MPQDALEDITNYTLYPYAEAQEVLKFYDLPYGFEHLAVYE